VSEEEYRAGQVFSWNELMSKLNVQPQKFTDEDPESEEDPDAWKRQDNVGLPWSGRDMDIRDTFGGSSDV
jgi:hypothetical protein